MSQSISQENPLIKLKGKETTSLLKIGPIPSQRGQSSSDLGKQTAWDEKGRNKLAQMFVSFGNDYINSIAFQYIEDGKLVISPVFGSPNLDGPNFVALRFTEATNNEYITRLSGSHGTKNYSTGQGVTSLTIETNAAIYGPFGNAGSNDPKFNISFGPENQFAGFHGTSSPEILTSIGVYVKPIDDLAALSNKTELHVE
ncbi:hypothetical protein RND81_14G092700 [Saponaria officinalis]|uniref:Jacalin-type lectin domain-containing protein n=1 Tax=Saponaria officinalis TaxID=3572 RepID=A0AAW1GK92_SAPOF